MGGCFLHHPLQWGDGGQGYGVIVYKTTDSLFENNIISRCRHAYGFGAGSLTNVVAYNYILDPAYMHDICLHGETDKISPDSLYHTDGPEYNLFEGNIARDIGIDSAHGYNGIHNTFLRNRLGSRGKGIYIDGKEIWYYRAAETALDILQAGTFVGIMCYLFGLEFDMEDFTNELDFYGTYPCDMDIDPEGVYMYGGVIMQPAQIFINNYIKNGSWKQSNIFGFGHLIGSKNTSYERNTKLRKLNICMFNKVINHIFTFF